MLENPESLVGKRIKHLVQEQKESDPEWYDATVLKIDKPNQDNPLRTENEIIYDLDGEDIKFSYPLLMDLKNGNLVIID